MPRAKVDAVRTHVSLDRPTVERLNFFLLDPAAGRVQYGALKEILNRLLRQFVSSLETSEDPVRLLRAYGVKIEIPETNKEPDNE